LLLSLTLVLLPNPLFLALSFEIPTFPIDTVWFLGEQPLFNRMSGAPGTSSVAGAGADNDNNLGIISSGDIFSPGQSSYVSSVTTSTTKIKVEEILSVWDFPRVEKSGSKGVL
jgi:hypothetical protein